MSEFEGYCIETANQKNYNYSDNSDNSIPPEFHPATKPLIVEPVDSGNEIGLGHEERSIFVRASKR